MRVKEGLQSSIEDTNLMLHKALELMQFFFDDQIELKFVHNSSGPTAADYIIVVSN